MYPVYECVMSKPVLIISEFRLKNHNLLGGTCPYRLYMRIPPPPPPLPPGTMMMMMVMMMTTMVIMVNGSTYNYRTELPCLLYRQECFSGK